MRELPTPTRLELQQPCRRYDASARACVVFAVAYVTAIACYAAWVLWQ
ncbi:hypothetical protein [Caldimonas tepidiphila]|nr:hypothetical protein [Caldimonas tepidiphila]